MFRFRRACERGVLIAVTAMASLASPVQAEQVVNIYSYREPKLTEPLLAAFTAKTGIKTNVIFASAGLVERIAAEGASSPADVILANEFGWLIQAKQAGVTQPTTSKFVDAQVPAELRDPEDHWIGLTRRARIVYASRDRVAQDAISYEELADPKWRGKICMRSGQHTYNIALISAMLARLGEEKTETWLNGVKANLARRPAGGDREQVRDVQAGLCDLAVGNTYYMVAMQKSPEQKVWADAVKMLFPNAADNLTHVNISGIALSAHAPNKDNALQLIEYLTSNDAQQLYAETNGEYPVVANVPSSELVASWGQLKADPVPLSTLAGLRKKASELVDKVRFDQGPNS